MFIFFFFSSRRRHTRSVSAFLLNRSSDLVSIWRIISETCCCLERLVFSIIDATRAVDSFRSEERRVGKECRSRGSSYLEKKNNCSHAIFDEVRVSQRRNPLVLNIEDASSSP